MLTRVLRLPVVALVRWPNATLVVRSVAVAVVVLASGALAGRSLDAEYTNRALPGLSVGGVPVGSLDAGALRERLGAAAVEWQPRAIEVRSTDRAWLASDASLGLVPDLDAAIRSALTYGKEGPLVVRLGAWVSALSGSVALALPLRSASLEARDGLAAWVEAVARSAELPAGEGALTVDATGVRATPPRVGRYVDRVALTRALQTAPWGIRDRRIDLPVREVHPALLPASFAQSVALARAGLEPLSVTAAGATIDVEPRSIAAFMAIRRVPVAAMDPASPVASEGAFVPAVRARFEVVVDEARLSEVVAALAARLGRPASDAGYALRANGTLAVLRSSDGQSVDRTALTALLRRAVSDPAGPRTAAVATIPIPAAFSTVQAERDAQLLTRVGFAEQYHASAPLPLVALAEFVLLPGASVAGDSLPLGVAEALFAAAVGAGYAVEGPVPGWRNDTAHPIYARSSNTTTSIAWDLWSVPSDRQVTFNRVGTGSVRRTVARAGSVLSSEVLSERFGPLQGLPRAVPVIPVTGTATVR